MLSRSESCERATQINLSARVTLVIATRTLRVFWSHLLESRTRMVLAFVALRLRDESLVAGRHLVLAVAFVFLVARVRLIVDKEIASLTRVKLWRLRASASLSPRKFDDVVVLWNRCAHLDEIEEAVLMTRSRDFGLTRPLAEAVLEVVETDPNPDGAALEYIVVAKLPRALAEVRALA